VRAAACLALVASGLIALTACSSGSPSPGATGGPPLTVHVSSKYTEEFATPVPAGSTQAAVISGWRESQVIWDQATITLHKPATTTEYITKNALGTLDKAVQGLTEANLVPVGTDRFFDTKITSMATNSATVTSCDDGSRYEMDDRTTGKQQSPTPLSQDYLYVVFDMIPLDGRWALSSLTVVENPDKRAKACETAARTSA
jgi:hypothetical protein